MLTRKEYAYTAGTPGTVNRTTTYAYGNAAWKDQLTGISVSDGTSLAVGKYDSLGNPGTYRGMSMEWKNGRELAKVTKNGIPYQFAYDSDGNRIAKKRMSGQAVVSSTEYYLNGSTILGINKDGKEVLFAYDQDGRPFAMKVMEGTDAQYYYYIYNVQGDVIGLVDKSGTKVVTYIYDSWGKLLPGSTSSTLASLNPFRYRGYCYDEETGLYYLKTRYYDPEVGRFVSADDPDILKVQDDLYDKNLYAYCDNDPVNRIDEVGDMWELALAGGGTLATGSGFSLGAMGGSVMTALGAITPAGWAVIGTIAVVGVISIGIKYAKSKEEVDPYARLGQKNREEKIKIKADGMIALNQGIIAGIISLQSLNGILHQGRDIQNIINSGYSQGRRVQNVSYMDYRKLGEKYRFIKGRS